MYQTQTFNIPELKGISKFTVEQHLKLYAGYVKFTNAALIEPQSRLGFEWNGMRNHEYYFKSLEDGAQALLASDKLKKAVDEQFGSFEKWQNEFTGIALTRGVGWAMMYYDPKVGKIINTWVDEHHLGQLGGLPIVLALDMWEHAFIADYTPADKKKYIMAFFENLNWNVIEKNYLIALG